MTVDIWGRLMDFQVLVASIALTLVKILTLFVGGVFVRYSTLIRLLTAIIRFSAGIVKKSRRESQLKEKEHHSLHDRNVVNHYGNPLHPSLNPMDKKISDQNGFSVKMHNSRFDKRN
jgi:hypothetical protein